MKVSLIFPRIRHESCGDPPLGLAYIASYLKKKINAEINIIDAAFYPSFNSLAGLLQRERPDVVGIYFSTAMYDYGVQLCRLARKIGAYVVAGGPHATILPQSLVNEADVVAVGEGEETFAEVIEAYIRKEPTAGIAGIWFRDNGRIIRNIGRRTLPDLDALPHPAREMLDMERYMDNCLYFDAVDIKLRATTIIASRGCPFQCTYCQPTLDTLFGRGTRMRSPQNIVAEIKHLRDEYEVDAVYFHDDTLIFNRGWVKDFCRLIISETPGLVWGCNTRVDSIDEEMIDVMHKAGLRCLHLGAESASQRILDDIYRKDITLVDIEKAVKVSKAKNIRTMCFFMLGAPTETKQEMNRTISFARNLPLDEAVFYITCPMPQTHLYHLTQKLGFMISSKFSDFNFYSKRSYDNSALRLWQIKLLQLKAHIIFYLRLYRLKYILKHLASFKGVRRLSLKITRFF